MMADESFSADKDTLEAAIKRGIDPSESSSPEDPSFVVQSTSDEEISLAREWGWQGGSFGALARDWGWQGGGFGVIDIPRDIAETIGIRLGRTWGWEHGGWNS